MKPIRKISQTSRDNCLTACLLMMTDLDPTEDLWRELDALYKRSANVQACASLMSISNRAVNIAAGHWLESGYIYLVFAVKQGAFHALIVDCRGFSPVVYDPAEEWDSEMVFSWETESNQSGISLNKAPYFPVLRFTDRIWYGH